MRNENKEGSVQHEEANRNQVKTPESEPADRNFQEQEAGKR